VKLLLLVILLVILLAMDLLAMDPPSQTLTATVLLGGKEEIQTTMALMTFVLSLEQAY
jgi:hypothetical protein